MSATVLPLQNTERECQAHRERRSGKCTRRPERVVIEGGVGGIMRCGRNSGVTDWVVVVGRSGVSVESRCAALRRSMKTISWRPWISSVKCFLVRLRTL